MKLTKMVTALLIAMIMVVLAGCGSSGSQTAPKKAQTDFPKKEITIVVPWNAGGGNDVMARKVATIFKEMGITAVVKNVPGGNGVVGINEVVTAKPDGYTVGVQTSSTLSAMALGKTSIKADKMTNISLMCDEPHILVVRGDAPWKNLKEMIDYMKVNPNKVTIATPGSNNVNHAVAAMLGKVADVEFQHVPFDGGALVIPQLLGGHVDAAVLKPSEVVAQIKEGKFKGFGVNDDKRLANLPEVPTFKEGGFDLFKAGPVKQMSFIVAPAGLDPAVRDKLVEIFNKATQSEGYQKLGKDSGFNAPLRTPSDLDNDVKAFLSSEAFTKIFK